MDIETMPHAIYFLGNTETVTKINHVPYQTVQYDNKGMFPAQLMDDTPTQVFIDNGATPSILPISTYNKHPVLQKYPKTKSTTSIHTGGGTIKSHFWIEFALKLENQVIKTKALVCDSECPYDILIGGTSLAHLNVRILPGHIGIVSTALKKGKTTFTQKRCSIC